MNKTVLREKHYGHTVEITIHEVMVNGKVNPEHKIESLCGNAYSCLIDELSQDATKGIFSHENTKELDNDKETGLPVEISFEGTWRVIELDYEVLKRIVLWQISHNREEALSEEVFIKHFGESYGKHYFSKWHHTYGRNLMEMANYFRTGSSHGQPFCDMLMEQVGKFENRNNNTFI